MSDLAVTHTFNSGDIVSASKFNTNYTTDICGYINARNSGSSTWDFFHVTNGSGVPLTVNNSTGSSSIVQMQDNGTNIFEVFDGGIVTKTMESAVRLVLGFTAALSSGVASPLANWVITGSLGGSYDIQSESNPSAGTITVLKSGKYLINASLELIVVGDTSVVSDVYIYKNGASISQATKIPKADGGFISMNLNIQDIVNLNAGDVLQLYGRVSNFSGAEARFQTFTYFEVHKLS